MALRLCEILLWDILSDNESSFRYINLGIAYDAIESILIRLCNRSLTGTDFKALSQTKFAEVQIFISKGLILHGHYFPLCFVALTKAKPIDDFAQDCGDSSVLAIEFPQSWAKSSK